MKNGLRTVLLLDSDASWRRNLKSLLETASYSVCEAASAENGIEMIEEGAIDVLLMSSHASASGAANVCATVLARYPETEIVLIHERATGTESISLEDGIHYLSRPFSNELLFATLRQAVEKKILREELIRLREYVAMSYGYDNIIGVSKSIVLVRDTVRRIAPTHIPVLLTGPAGCGKEFLARTIHHHSSGRGNRFVTVDCALIPAEQIEAHIFGNGDIPGSITQANNGTLFLDDVLSLPHQVQTRLSEFMLTKTLTVSGVSKQMNVRVISSASPDAASMVKTGHFKEELFHQLGVITIAVPSLKQRTGDIEMLAEYFLRRIAAENGQHKLAITRAALDTLSGFSWPGNVRELENTLRRAAALCEGEVLDVADIAFINYDTRQIDEDSFVRRPNLVPTTGGLLQSSQRSLIAKALSDNNWNYTQTAAALGIGRTTLWRKMKKFELGPETTH